MLLGILKRSVELSSTSSRGLRKPCADTSTPRCSKDGRNWSRPWESVTHRLLHSSPTRRHHSYLWRQRAAEYAVKAHIIPLRQRGPHHYSSWYCPCWDNSRTPGVFWGAASRQAPTSTHFYLVFFLTVALSVPRLPRASR